VVARPDAVQFIEGLLGSPVKLFCGQATFDAGTDAILPRDSVEAALTVQVDPMSMKAFAEATQQENKHI
jgi:hypothetical protein